MSRSRTCVNGAPGDIGCRGPVFQNEDCNVEVLF